MAPLTATPTQAQLAPGESGPVKPVHAWSDSVALPGADGFLTVIDYQVRVGHYALVSLVQGVKTNTPGQALPRVIPGIVWKLQIAEGDTGRNAKEADVSPAGGSILWTFNDGTPVVRNLMVAPGKRLIFGADISLAAIPGALGITDLLGAVLGFEWTDRTVSASDIFPLYVTP